ncbi:MAG: hypothetical protein GXP18_04955 [Gammaproteobacteria bacterium]|nr:hypothetical protein [Gammaproteobacteria bacterium]
MKKYLLWLLLCISSSIAYADEEDWYTYWAIGAANFDYPGSLDSDLDSIEALPGVDRTRTGFDFFGFYWPQAENSLLGFIASGSTDSFKTRYEKLNISQNLFGISGMKFFGREIGDGFFIRGDAGLAQIVVKDSLSTTISDTGFGYLLGAGYAFPVSSETRILISVNFSDKQVEGNSWKSTTFTVGGLW